MSDRSEKAKAYRTAHPETNMAADFYRRFGERLDKAIIARVMQGPCFRCGVTPAGGVDHIISKSNGGRNIEANTQPACRKCNHSKGFR